jgi:hypothetical protein
MTTSRTIAGEQWTMFAASLGWLALGRLFPPSDDLTAAVVGVVGLAINAALLVAWLRSVRWLYCALYPREQV